METQFDPDPSCEACRQAKPVEKIRDDAEDDPYLLCNECAKRLRLRALRPLEWFNVASVHGAQKHALHDDFYDEDGTATQPDINDFSTDGMIAPSLPDTCQSVERLFDYCVTRWKLGDAEFDALRALPTDKVFDNLRDRAATGNTDILRVALTICANVLDDVAEAWVRDQYQRACEQGALNEWSKAAAACLPQPDGVNMTISALEGFQGRELYYRIETLACFRSPLVLDWIERRAPTSNVGENWGRLAARSCLTWPRAEAWLARGRPLSLIALDALYELSVSRDAGPNVEGAHELPLDAPKQKTIMNTLRHYMLEDTSSRSMRLGEYLIDNAHKIRISNESIT